MSDMPSQLPLSRKERRHQSKEAKKSSGRLSGVVLDAIVDGALSHQEAGRLNEAERLYKRALAGKLSAKRYAIIANSLGVVLRDQKRPEEAITWYRRALQYDPNLSAAYGNLGAAHNDLGQQDKAVEAFRRAAARDPKNADAHSNLGAILDKQGATDESAKCYKRALAINPNHAVSHFNLGNLYRTTQNTDQAIESYRSAVSCQPNFKAALDNLISALQSTDRLEEVVDCYLQSIRAFPEVAQTHWDLASIQLTLGNLEDGWEGFEWRWKLDDFPSPRRNFPQALWDGGDLTDKSILVWAELGVGDEILFASMMPDIIATAGHCAIECEPRLVDLFARSFPQAEIHPRPFEAAETGKAAFDYQIPMGSLPRYLRPSLASFPSNKPYLVAEQKRSDFWRQRLNDLGPKPKVGIAWRSKFRSADRNLYFAAIEELGPILTVDDVTFVNLQYDDCRAEITEAKDRFGVTLHSWDDIDLMNDLDEAAALTSNLDLVVTAYTSVANMAGALGVPVFSFVPNKRYWISMGAEHVPWYPDTRFFRQTEPGDWQGAFENIADAIRKL